VLNIASIQRLISYCYNTIVITLFLKQRYYLIWDVATVCWLFGFPFIIICVQIPDKQSTVKMQIEVQKNVLILFIYLFIGFDWKSCKSNGTQQLAIEHCTSLLDQNNSGNTNTKKKNFDKRISSKKSRKNESVYLKDRGTQAFTLSAALSDHNSLRFIDS
jgi:hypothetical protein